MVTPEKSKVTTEAAVDNFGRSARVDAASWPRVDVVGPVTDAGAELVDAGKAEQLLGSEIRQMVRDRLRIPPGQAETLLERWRRELGDDPVTLVTIIRGVAAAANPERPSHFQIMISDAIKLHMQRAVRGRELPLVHVIDKRGGAA
jgi:hypothetical protein